MSNSKSNFEDATQLKEDIIQSVIEFAGKSSERTLLAINATLAAGSTLVQNSNIPIEMRMAYIQALSSEMLDGAASVIEE